MIENIPTHIPADEIASTTPAAETTGEPVTNQAPDSQIDNTIPAAKLPDGYGDLMETTPDGKKFLKRDYVDRYTKELAAAHHRNTCPYRSSFQLRFPA